MDISVLIKQLQEVYDNTGDIVVAVQEFDESGCPKGNTAVHGLTIEKDRCVIHF